MRKIDVPTLFKGIIALGLFLIVAVSPVFSQTEDKFSFDITVNSDQFFGFYPFFAGSYEVSETSAFTFYGILWSGGTGGVQGAGGGGWGNWTEFGVGMNFDVADGLSINPQVGITGGNLLSSGTAGPSIFGDGIVPNLTIGLDKARTEGEIYFGFYSPLRNKAPEGGTTLSYIHYWANFGVKASDFFSIGLHYEQLTNAGGSNVTSSTDVYQWLGPYIQFSDPKGKAFARLSAGGDLVEGNDSFFKVTTGLSF
ncbi:DUF6733 family protein [Negadavirga shengliensis]|uniref:DUF6733 family protein n=1 Tax=Negadavirga shengliensis TaxID=1389218 RepID=A0ABV9T4J3_9BACT